MTLNWKLAFLMTALLSIGGCEFLSSRCQDEIKKELRSPDSKYSATVYERDCGATTNFSTIVNLRESSAKFKGDDLGIVIVKGQHAIDLAWDGNTTLRLQCRNCRSDEIFKQEKTWKNVEVFLVH
jgi:hypothetical protein